MKTLFDSIELKRMPLKNRLVMAPMTRSRAEGGVPTRTMVEYYRRRAAGGIGLIISEGVLVDHPEARVNAGEVPYLRADSVEGWRRVAEAVHAEGSRIFPQIWHCGPVVRPGVAGRSITDDDGNEVVRLATAEDRTALQQAYSHAAEVSPECGFDGVELHGAHGYLLDSFLRAGDTGFVTEIIRETRLKIGPDLPLCFRFSNWTAEDLTASYFDTPAELERLLKLMIEAGVDIFHPSTRRFWEPVFDDDPLTLAGWTRRITGMPTIIVGNIGLKTEGFSGPGPESLESLERLLNAGEFDLAAVGRPLITEPEWGNKVRDRRFSEIADFYERATKEVFP
jgi:2,4-dienoyl-CoA reductase-like NADH-dependent reductase (Old Yellow Enzyme family)